jgi:P-type Ca2+ transporter type 2C
LIHVASMHIPLMQGLLGIEPVSLTTWGVVIALAFLVIPALELHKWSWRLRHPA